jgi:sulfoxide reductase heme-binding subunit YedZ
MARALPQGGALRQAANGTLRRVPVWLVYALGAMPALWLLWLIISNGLGFDPVKELEHRLGKLGLQFIVAGLAITPLRKLTGISLLRFRRAVGLLAFGYVALHLSVWLLLDIQLRWAEIGKDIVKRPYITVGMLGFAALVPLALTSNDLALRKMGARAWQRLHRLVYFAALAGAVHYVLVVKAWPPEPLVYLGVVAGLLALRLRWRRRHAVA